MPPLKVASPPEPALANGLRWCREVAALRDLAHALPGHAEEVGDVRGAEVAPLDQGEDLGCLRQCPKPWISTGR